MSLEFSNDDRMKGYAKSIRNLRKIIDTTHIPMKTILRKKYGTKFLLHHICIRVSPIVNNKRKPLLWICNEKKSRTWFVYAKFSKILQVDFHEWLKS